jgi:very-short-patch-repair endonuclease
MTRAETLLWRYLKAGHLNGLQFRRQTPMGQYIVDFVCHAARIVIELDGESHDFAERIRQDRVRDAWLTSRGYKVLRFMNDDVMSNLEGVLLAISEAASARVRGTPPSLTLPRKGTQRGRERTEFASRLVANQRFRWLLSGLLLRPLSSVLSPLNHADCPDH